MNSKVWIQKAISMCLLVATVATYSTVTLANSERIVGELSVSGKNLNGENPFVKVNGEAAQTGRSIFSSSVVATPADAGATISLGKAGEIALAPNTTLMLSFNDKGISGDLSAGQITVLSASNAVSIKTLDGSIVNLNAGDSAAASSGKAQDDDDDDSDGGGSGWLIFAGVLGGAAVAVIVAATSDNNRVSLGGSTSVISPTR